MASDRGCAHGGVPGVPREGHGRRDGQCGPDGVDPATGGGRVRSEDLTSGQRNVTLDTLIRAVGILDAGAVELRGRAAPSGQRIRLFGVSLEGLQNADRVTEQQ